MDTIYVRAKSKADLNRRLTAGELICGISYKPTSADVVYSTHWEAGTVVKIWEKMVCGSPYAKAYGTVRVKNGQRKVA